TGGESATPIVTGVTTASYTNTGLTAGTKYYYKIASVDAAGTSAQSSEVSATPTGTAPAAPTGLTATGGTTQVALSWTASTGATSYNIFRGTASGGESATAIATGVTTASYTNTGLTAGSMYYYKVAALNSYGTSAQSTEASAITIAGVPAGVTATAGVNQVALTWTATTGAASYAVYRGTATGGESATPIVTGVTTASYTNTGLTAGTKYYYKVASVDAAGTSAQSSEVSATPTGTAPAAPTGLTATGGTTQVVLAWTASTGATSYNVYRGTASGGESATAIATGVTTVSYTNTGLTAGTTYYYKVAALNSYGTSAQSTEASSITVAAVPTGLTATGGNTQIALSWTAVSGAASYAVYSGTASGGEGATPVATGITTASYTNTGLTAGSTYYYKVSAVDAAGTSAQSSEASAITIAGIPTGLTPTAGVNQVALTWTSVTGAAFYAVYSGTVSGGESATPIATGVTASSYTNTGLTAGTTYYYKVTAVDAAGTSAESTEVSATPTGAPPTTPTGLTATGGTAQVALAWTAGTGATSYNIYRGTASGGESATAVASGITLVSYTNTGLSAGVAYFYKVAAVNAYGTSAQSTEATASTLAGVPAGLTATAGNAQVALTWTAATGAVTYSLYRGTATGGEGSTPYLSGLTGTAYTDTGLADGTSYFYKLASVDAGGTSAQSNEASATPIAVVPSTPVGFSAAGGNTQVALVWSATAGATSYCVYRGTTSGGEGSTAHATGVTGTDYTDTGLTNGVPYFYTVAAVGTAGTSAKSVEVSATPAAEPPSTPTGLTATAGNAQVSPSWTPGLGATSYNLYRSTTSGGESNGTGQPGANVIAPAISGPIDGSQSTAIISAEASRSSLARLADAEPLTLSFVLPVRSQAALADRIRREYDPNDALYGKYITPTQFAEQFGPTAAQVAVVKEYAVSQGFTIVSVSPNNAIVKVRATAAGAGSAFGVHLLHGTSVSGRSFISPDREPTIPSALSGKIVAVLGLDTSLEPHRYSQLALAGKRKALTPDLAFYSGAAGLAPSDVRSVYGFTPPVSGTAPVSVGLLEMDGWTPGDISEFESYNGIPNVVPQLVSVDGGTGVPTTSDGAGETTLDIEMVLALAPEINSVYVYQAPSNDSTENIDLLNAVASDDVVKVASMSYGTSEMDILNTPGGTAFLNAENQVLAQMAVQGQTLCVAAGDSGAYSDETLFPTTNASDPATQPYVLSVGGTNLTDDQNYDYVKESSWGDTSDQSRGVAGTGGGGGISAYWPIPAWQVPAINTTVNPQGSTTFRNLPDVSLYGDFDTGYYSILFTNPTANVGPTWVGANGTSAAAPLWAAFLAGVDVKRLGAGLPAIGFANPALYYLAQSRYPSDFHDINDGSNNLYYNSVTGYDNSTGWGSFQGNNLMADLSAYGSTASTVYATTTGASYLDTAVENGTTYYYRVSAVNGVGTSAQSNEANATPVGVPATPAGLAATAGSAQVTLSWTAAGQAATYNLYRGTASGGEGSAPYETELTGTSYTDTGVTSGVAYYYKLASVNAAGTSAQSSEASAMPLATPAGLTAAGANALVALSWAASAGATSYSLYRSTVSGAEGTTPYATGVTGTSYTNTGLTNGSTYYYKLAAVNSTGISTQSGEVYATPATSPTGLTATPGNALITLAWSTTSGATSYSLYRATTSGGEGTTAYKTGITTTSYTDSGLTNGTAYFYKLASVSSTGTSTQSSEVTATPAATPSTPTNVAAAAGNAQITLSWTASSGASSYNLYRATASGAEGSTAYKTGLTGTS
ncbi:MAG: fibronectin type III domain-containing protein, partial [Capsulimonadaceae bacterium]